MRHEDIDLIKSDLALLRRLIDLHQSAKDKYMVNYTIAAFIKIIHSNRFFVLADGIGSSLITSSEYADEKLTELMEDYLSKITECMRMLLTDSSDEPNRTIG